mmetsp:Transcript_5044/g.12778  ORF Transcript_5044/g.12778 Transcript_5044/m.12778 type:complete len:154 (-) Transcript_5044:255-716(-)
MAKSPPNHYPLSPRMTLSHAPYMQGRTTWKNDEKSQRSSKSPMLGGTVTKSGKSGINTSSRGRVDKESKKSTKAASMKPLDHGKSNSSGGKKSAKEMKKAPPNDDTRSSTSNSKKEDHVDGSKKSSSRGGSKGRTTHASGSRELSSGSSKSIQ